MITEMAPWSPWDAASTMDSSSVARNVAPSFMPVRASVEAMGASVAVRAVSMASLSTSVRATSSYRARSMTTWASG